MIVSIINQKGGTGKTTTTLNLGRALTLHGYRVLLIDMDPQANLTYSLAIKDFEYSIKDLLSGKIEFNDAKIEADHLDIIPTTIDLAYYLSTMEDDFLLLHKELEACTDYDFILIDCPPSLSGLTLNALYASNYVLIPMQLDVFSIMGLLQIINTITEVRLHSPNNLEILGVLPVMVDLRKRLTEEVLAHVDREFDVNVFKCSIRTNVKAAEAPSFGQSVIDYAPDSNSAMDYKAFTNELLQLLEERKELNIN
ncbi:ParA family protein [Fulvivirga sp.]|uniref:ParA family protein n=1 Tax=Fulvivirga sp. TaxID=1931237 RepID=UPI0032EB98E0